MHCYSDLTKVRPIEILGANFSEEDRIFHILPSWPAGGQIGQIGNGAVTAQKMARVMPSTCLPTKTPFENSEFLPLMNTTIFFEFFVILEIFRRLVIKFIVDIWSQSICVVDALLKQWNNYTLAEILARMGQNKKYDMVGTWRTSPNFIYDLNLAKNWASLGQN